MLQIESHNWTESLFRIEEVRGLYCVSASSLLDRLLFFFNFPFSFFYSQLNLATILNGQKMIIAYEDEMKERAYSLKIFPIIHQLFLVGGKRITLRRASLMAPSMPCGRENHISCRGKFLCQPWRLPLRLNGYSCVYREACLGHS